MRTYINKKLYDTRGNIMISTIHPGIFTCIGICAVMLIGVMGKKTIITLFKRGIVGVSLIIAINLVVPETLEIGINFITIGCTSLLGVPGVVMLYIINLMI